MENKDKSFICSAPGQHIIRSFGRRHGKKLSKYQQNLIDNLLPALLPKIDDKAGILEIGFGAGEHLLELSESNPNSIIIGAEPYINGIASLLSRMTQPNSTELLKPEYKNIRLFPDDIRNFLISNSQLKFEQIWILHPDPWPKARHEKRRLLQSEFLNLLSGYLSENGKIIIGTDHNDYYNWILDQIKSTGLKITDSQFEIIKTRYQKKDMFGAKDTKYIVLKI